MFASNMNQAVLNLISKFSNEYISLHQAMKQCTRMNSKIRNALLIIMNDRSFELSENSVYVRVHVYCSREYDVLSIFPYTVVAYKFCSKTVVAYHIYSYSGVR